MVRVRKCGCDDKCYNVSLGMSNNNLAALIAGLHEEGGAVRIGGCR
jgi:hypothetical protein